MVVRAALATHVAAGLHGTCKFLGMAQGTCKERHQDGNEEADTVDKTALVKAGAARSLRRHDVLDLVEKRGHEANGDGVHHGKLVDGQTKARKGCKQALGTVGNRDRRSHQREDGTGHHERKHAKCHVDALDERVVGDGEAQEVRHHVALAHEEDVDERREDDEEPQRLDRLANDAQRHAGQGRRKHEYHGDGNEAPGRRRQEHAHHEDDHDGHLHARVERMKGRLDVVERADGDGRAH